MVPLCVAASLSPGAHLQERVAPAGLFGQARTGAVARPLDAESARRADVTAQRLHAKHQGR